MSNNKKISTQGYALILAILAINIFTIMALVARNMWETEIQRDLEEELLFRARQYVFAIDLYQKKNNNMAPQNLEMLLEDKFLRKLYKDPMSESGKWNMVMTDGSGADSALLIVPEEMLPQYITRARLIGVCSTSQEEGFRIYRKKKKYSEWAIYLGEQPDKEMPELKFVDQPGGEDSNSENPPIVNPENPPERPPSEEGGSEYEDDEED